MRTYSSYYSSRHFASLSLLSLLRSIIAIIITSLDHRYHHHFARPSPSPLSSLRSALAIVIIITPLGHRYRYYHHSARPSLFLSLSLRSVIAIPIIITSLGYRHYYYFARLSPLLLFRIIFLSYSLSNMGNNLHYKISLYILEIFHIIS